MYYSNLMSIELKCVNFYNPIDMSMFWAQTGSGDNFTGSVSVEDDLLSVFYGHDAVDTVDVGMTPFEAITTALSVILQRDAIAEQHVSIGSVGLTSSNLAEIIYSYPANTGSKYVAFYEYFENEHMSYASLSIEALVGSTTNDRTVVMNELHNLVSRSDFVELVNRQGEPYFAIGIANLILNTTYDNLMISTNPYR